MTHLLVRTSKCKSASLLTSANKNKSAESKEEPRGQDSDNGKAGKLPSGEQSLEAEGAALEEGDMTKELVEEEEESRTDEPVLTPGATVVCTEGMATRIHRVIVKSILPLLHKCLTHKVGVGVRGVGVGCGEVGGMGVVGERARGEGG